MTHGLAGTYTNHRCRCQLCRGAMAAYHRDRRLSQKVRGRCYVCNAEAAETVVNLCRKHADMRNANARAYRARQAEVSHV